MVTHKLRNTVTFRGGNVPRVDDEKKQTRELLEKYNISKEYLQKKSGTVRYSFDRLAEV